MLGTKEHYGLMDQFEELGLRGRFDRESKDLWPRKRFYQDGEVNEKFVVYMAGYVHGKCVQRIGLFD